MGLPSILGKRKEPNNLGQLILEPGEYGRHTNGTWYACPPGQEKLTANLAAHEVEEHRDGSITASPSIVVSNNVETWHGYLRQGIWEQV